MAAPDHRSAEAVAFVDDDGDRVVLSESEAVALFGLTAGLEAATVSACPRCRSCIVAVVALVDLLDGTTMLPRARELIDLAEDAPTLHLYVDDLISGCAHVAWIDPGYEEWADALADTNAAHPPAP
jgi:hypothetical protein